MTLARRNGCFTAWIAIFAILLAALAPSVARALAPAQQAAPWSEICSASGVQVAHEVAPLSGSGQHGDAGFKHCPLCLNYVGQFAMPTTPFSGLPLLDRRAESFPASISTTTSRFLLVAAQPRAPPAVS